MAPVCYLCGSGKFITQSLHREIIQPHPLFRSLEKHKSSDCASTLLTFIASFKS